MPPSPEIFLAVSLLSVSLLGGAAPLRAAQAGVQASVLGHWCEAGAGSEQMFVETTSVGFNEHTVCRPDTAVPDASQFATQLDCANVYMTQDGPQRAFATTLWAMGALNRNDRLFVAFFEKGQAGRTMIFTRCQP